MDENRQPLSVILGIFVGVSATFSLENFISYPILEWIGYSVIVATISILFIYLMISNNKTDNKLSPIRWISLILVTTFPFSFFKVNSINPLPEWGLFVHGLFVGASLVFMGYFDKGLDKTRKITSKVTGWVVVVISGFLILKHLSKFMGGGL